MATKTSSANPIANFYEAQTVATAEIANAALNGMQRLQKLTLQAMRAGADGQLSLAQSMASDARWRQYQPLGVKQQPPRGAERRYHPRWCRRLPR